MVLGEIQFLSSDILCLPGQVLETVSVVTGLHLIGSALPVILKDLFILASVEFKKALTYSSFTGHAAQHCIVITM